MLSYLKKSSIFVAVTLAFSLALVGCSGKEKQVEGKWKVDTSKLPTSASTGAAAKSMFSGISLEFKADSTFSAVIGATAEEGTWTVDGNTVTMTPSSTSGVPSNHPPGTATLSDDGKSLTISSSVQGLPLSFVKASP